MTLEEIRARFSGLRLNITLEGTPESGQILVFSPKNITDMDFAILQAKAVGMELLRSGKIQKFNGGIDVVKDGESAACKVYLRLNSVSSSDSSKPSSPQQDLSPFFSSAPPFLEKVVLEYFPNPGGFFIETKVGKGLEGSVSKFFDEFFGWEGLLLEVEEFYDVFNNRTVNLPAGPNTPKKDVGCVYGNLISSKHPASNTDIHIKTLLESYGVSRVDWIHFREKGSVLLGILEDLTTASALPKLITVDYVSDEASLHDIAPVLFKAGYRLDRVYYNYGIFLRV